MNDLTAWPSADTRARDWAASGAHWLTGRADDAPVQPPGGAASQVVAALATLGADLHRLTGATPALPGVELLGERAALTGATRRGPFAPGGRTRALRTLDGWVALTLARPEDLDLLPALLERDLPVSGADDGSPESLSATWAALEEWAGTTTSAEADARIRLLGLPGRRVDTAASMTPAGGRDGIEATPGGSRQVTARPLVVDFSSLWAGPLCAHLLGLGGARVVKVESASRPDGARTGDRTFYDLLHAGHASVAVDFTDADDRARLLDLVRRADVVIEASRPRALARLGLDASEHVSAGTIWLSITAEGRACDAIGFGDDVALGAGIAVRDGHELLPVGDALADPLSGVMGAAAVARALLEPRGVLLDLSMLDVCRASLRPEDALGAAPAAGWPSGTDQSGAASWPALPPTPRVPSGRAPASGAHTARWLR